MKHLVSLTAAVLITLGAAPAWAQKPSAAFTSTFQAGVDAFRLGQYDEAVRHLEAAAQLEPTLPGPHRFLAAVAAAQSRWPDCIGSARTAIALNPQSSEIGATRKLHDDCRQAAGRPAFEGDYGDGGAVAVTANVAGATVTVGGLKYGATPLMPRAIPLGEVAVTATKAGYKPAETTTTILPGVVTDVELTLEEDPAASGPAIGEAPAPELGWLRVSAPPGASVRIDGKPATLDERGRFALTPGSHELEVDAPGRVPARRTVRVSKGQETTVAVALESRSARASRQRTGRVAVAAAVGLGAVGAMTAMLSMQASDEARDAWTIEVTRPTTISLAESSQLRPLRTRADIAALVDRSDRWALVSNLSYAAAAFSLGVGVYMLARVAPEEPRTTAVTPLVGSTWGVAVSGVLP